MNKRTLIIGIAAIAGFLAFGVFSFTSMLTPYVSLNEAKSSKGGIQIAGKLDSNSIRYDDQTRTLHFRLTDEEGGDLQVAYRGPKPMNLEDATSVVAIGAYQEGAFQSTRLLVKCPSKYENAGRDRQYQAGQ